MIPSIQYLKSNLGNMLNTLHDQGHDTDGARKQWGELPDSYDKIIEFAQGLINLPMRSDWEYTEPLCYDEILSEMSPDRMKHIKSADTEVCAKKAEAAFLGSVLGCILGKPLEVNPSYAEMKIAGEKIGEWPFTDFISEKFLETLGRRHGSWWDTARGKISYAAADDDLNYSVMGMINLERYGLDLDYEGVKTTWLNHQGMNFAWGPERHITAWVAVNNLWNNERQPDEYYKVWSETFNPNSELCGAAIRADAYGYAFPGRPDLAAKYAFIDSSFTHQRTGCYSTMYIAAVISLLFVTDDPLDAFEAALDFVPQRSRFYKITKTCLEYVRAASTFEEGYTRINQRYGNYAHCYVYQEVGTLANTLKFADNIWDGVCKQVMQGNDTDSFGCTSGSMLGAFFGYDGLDMDRLKVFNDEIHVGLAGFYEHSLTKLAQRMGNLVRKFN